MARRALSLIAPPALACLCCAPPAEPPPFEEIAAAAGIDFLHDNGATGAFNYPELLHGGCAFVDTDGDGLLDVYLVQGGPLPEGGAEAPRNRLYRNLGDGNFDDVSSAAAVDDARYGTGVAAADYDNDGDVDLYVTNLGRNTLYRNDGNGRFDDVTEEAGVGDDGYSSVAMFVDYDLDGKLDLWVTNYIDWSPEIERPCFAPGGPRDYCSPGIYNRPALDTLYRNNGDGTFDDVSERVGIRAAPGAGLGVFAADLTGDGRVDFFVANDQMANFLWVQREDGTFADEALVRGCAMNHEGRSEASMGVAVADWEDDGDWDLFLTHLDGETNTFYRNDDGYFQDVTDSLRLGAVSRAYTGFGVALFDYDADGLLDVFLANGRVRLGDTMEAGSYAEPNQLLRGTADGSFEDVSERSGAALSLVEVSRGAAFGDVDNDGDVDILIANNDGPARLLRNTTGGENRSLVVELRGRTVDRNGIGSTVIVEAGGRRRQRLVQPAHSYGASNDPRIHFGLGSLETVERLIVIWPDGRTVERTQVPTGGLVLIEEP